MDQREAPSAMAATTKTTHNDHSLPSYLCLVPRGLQHVVSSVVHERLSPAYQVHVDLLGESDERNDAVLSATTQKINAKRDKRVRKMKMKQAKASAKAPDSAAVSNDANNTFCDRPVGSIMMKSSELDCQKAGCESAKARETDKDDSMEVEMHVDAVPTQNPTATSAQTGSKQPTVHDEEVHVGIGYHRDGRHIWSQAGQLNGSVWYKLQTDAPVKVVAKLRCFGPLLALVSATSAQAMRLGPHANLEDACTDLVGWIQQQQQQQQQQDDQYTANFESAVRLWAQHATQTWNRHDLRSQSREGADIKDDNTEMDDAKDFIDYKKRHEAGSVAYRLSCLRSGSSGRSSRSANKYRYTRQELLTRMLDNGLVPQSYQSKWKVDLTQYDVEVLLLILNRSMVAVALSLRPYQLRSATSFSNGSLPPDLTDPYIGGDILSGLVRLRPTTAHLLLKLANVQPGDIVLDPCAGIGTIPLEIDHHYFDGARRAIGLGGDLVLGSGTTIDHAAMQLLAASKRGNNAAAMGREHVDNLVGWDASLLPIRTGSVDVVVTDLPFGQSCLSAVALTNFLPLVFLEMARVLAPSAASASSLPSRAVLLCGSNHEVVMEALAASQRHWKLPYASILPVNITGILTWVFVIERNGVEFEPSITNHVERVRKMTKKRATKAQHEKSASHGHAKSNNNKGKKDVRRGKDGTEGASDLRGNQLKKKKRIQH